VSKKRNASKEPLEAEPYNNHELWTIGAFALRVMRRRWFADLFTSDEQQYMVPLLIGIYLCYEDGVLATKKQAMRFMRTSDGTTSQRYLGMAQQHQLINIVQSSIDKRADLLCPTEKLLDLVKHELSLAGDELRLAMKLIGVSNDTSFGKQVDYDFLTDETWDLLADQVLPHLQQPNNFWKLKLAQYSEMVNLMPNNASAWRQRAQAYTDAHEYEKAISDFNEAIRLSPNDPILYTLRAGCFYRKKDNARSAADYRHGLKLAKSRYANAFRHNLIITDLAGQKMAAERNQVQKESPEGDAERSKRPSGRSR
jgi:hypothetical protein